jgi:phosphomevalonate kinase
MIDIQASAPGKVIVAGEYAVLDGAPAICLAVNRRAQVSLRSCTEKHHTISAPGFSAHAGRFKSIDDSAKQYPLLAAVWQELQIETPDFLNIVLDSSGFSDAQSGKVGIGSSAALTVALTAALAHYYRLAGERLDIRSTAMAAHRRLQGAAGSGADIACSFAGGIIEYRMGENVSAKLDWPAGLNYALLWSGVPANTAVQLDKLGAAGAQESRSELGECAKAVAQAWNTSPSRLLSKLREYTATLRRFDVDHRLGIFDAGHAVLADTAESSEVVYKPCGAGGGDLGIAISSDESALTAFVDIARKQKFKLLKLTVEPRGIVVDGNK